MVLSSKAGRTAVLQSSPVKEGLYFLPNTVTRSLNYFSLLMSIILASSTGVSGLFELTFERSRRSAFKMRAWAFLPFSIGV